MVSFSYNVFFTKKKDYAFVLRQIPVLSETVIVVGNGIDDSCSNLNGAVCVSLHLRTVSLFLAAMGKW